MDAKRRFSFFVPFPVPFPFPFPILVLFLTGFVSTEVDAMDFTLASPAFHEGGAIPSRHTCDGRDLSPELNWQGVPEGSRSLVLIVEDPDAPDPAAPKRVWVHWVLYDIPPRVAGLSEGVVSLPRGTREGLNDWKRTGYGGPCPPVGRHRYFFRLQALDTELSDLGHPDAAALREAMKGHVLGEAVLMGTYARAR